MDKYQKNIQYKILTAKLTKAINNEFYYEAIFIEYALMEDRTSSLLKHAKIMANKLTLAQKIGKIQKSKRFQDSYIKKHLNSDLWDDVNLWRVKRNKLIHDLINVSYSNQEIKDIALEGYKIIKKLNSKSVLVNNYLDKLER